MNGSPQSWQGTWECRHPWVESFLGIILLHVDFGQETRVKPQYFSTWFCTIDRASIISHWNDGHLTNSPSSWFKTSLWARNISPGISIGDRSIGHVFEVSYAVFKQSEQKVWSQVVVTGSMRATWHIGQMRFSSTLSIYSRVRRSTGWARFREFWVGLGECWASSSPSIGFIADMVRKGVAWYVEEWEAFLFEVIGRVVQDDHS